MNLLKLVSKVLSNTLQSDHVGICVSELCLSLSKITSERALWLLRKNGKMF